MKTKTSELTGAALDWAVAQIESGAGADKAEKQWRYFGRTFHPSTDWAQGGPIIEREKIDIQCWSFHSMPWKASIEGDTDAGVALYEEYGPTPLIAAMRCYVASKLSEEVEVPDELH